MIRKILLLCCTLFALQASSIQAQNNKPDAKAPADIDQRMALLAQQLGAPIGMGSDSVAILYKEVLADYFKAHPALKGKIGPNDQFPLNDEDGNPKYYLFFRNGALAKVNFVAYTIEDDNASFEKSKKTETAMLGDLQKQLGYLPEPETTRSSSADKGDITTNDHRWRARNLVVKLAVRYINKGGRYSSIAVLELYKNMGL